MIIKSLKKNNININKINDYFNNNIFEEKILFLLKISNLLYKFNIKNYNKNNIKNLICNNTIHIKLLKKNKYIYMYGFSDSKIIRGIISFIFLFFNNKDINFIKNKKKYNFLFYKYFKKYKIIKNLNILYKIKKKLDYKFNKFINKYLN
ncbi:SufE family protein [Candidatus Nardonella dryophthoridicola]|uniref:Cysteine desulfuration protein SufE n=1 Tax=endosymbiont of Rhynchophorus ferrugineus TaxID=1972133 RepID=A0A2Z5T3Z3_9GAMM|nr:SufE family protein [Candidatus Nardonella dryophthoridicola]QTJ62875.1 SufE family protein [Candidatus Nardonella dryophthoridicola]BBA85121.1 cysteine desulfuration protein SufE [endosymbiont of Rhynchophorus ferrugineus]